VSHCTQSWFIISMVSNCTFLGINTKHQTSTSMFLASTVSTMHRNLNTHIWNASHPLLVTYYCWVTVYSPSMKAQQKKSRPHCRLRESIRRHLAFQNMCLSNMLIVKSNPMGCTFHLSNAEYHFKLHITTCVEDGKIQLKPKIINHLFACYSNCMCKSNPVCLIQQWFVIFLLASYVQWHYFLIWAYENQPMDFSPSMFTLKGYAVQCFTLSNEWIHFCTTLQIDLLAYKFLRRSKYTLQYKSTQAPLRSYNFGSTSIDLFPKSAVLLSLVLAKRDPT